jgi:hypothetical protein
LSFGKPGHDVEGQASASVHHNDPRRHSAVAGKEPPLLLLLGVVREAVSNNESTVVDPEAYTMAGQY